MKSLAAFRTRISPLVKGASDPLIDTAVLDTCIDFCERTLVVKAMADSVTTLAGQTEYDLDSGIVQIARVWVDGTEIYPLDEDGPGAFAFTSSIPGQTRPTGTPRFYLETDPGVMALYPTPDKAYTVTMRAAFKPLRSATQVEDKLYEDFCDDIVFGALSRLFAMPGEWESGPRAKYYEAKYEDGVSEALMKARSGVARVANRVMPVHI